MKAILRTMAALILAGGLSAMIGCAGETPAPAPAPAPATTPEPAKAP